MAGGVQTQLDNLVRAQFVREYRPVAIGPRRATRTMMYKLSDPFLLFYFRYIHKNRELIAQNRNENLFRVIAGQTIAQYYGYAWERLCEDAIMQILAALDLCLADILYMGPYFQRTTTRGDGLQIDWLIARRDGVWNILEYKYTKGPIPLAIVSEVQEKVSRIKVPDAVTVEPILVSAAGVAKSVQRTGYFASVLVLSDSDLL